MPVSRVVAGRDGRGQHQWTFTVIYYVRHPELPNHITDVDLIAGMGDINCLHCSTPYRAGIRYDDCPFAPIRRTPDARGVTA